MGSNECSINVEASKVLAEALQQMDGIIAGIDSDLTEMSQKPSDKISALLIELEDAIKLSEINNNRDYGNSNDNNTSRFLYRVDTSTVDRIISWLSINFNHSTHRLNGITSKFVRSQMWSTSDCPQSGSESDVTLKETKCVTRYISSSDSDDGNDDDVAKARSQRYPCSLPSQSLQSRTRRSKRCQRKLCGNRECTNDREANYRCEKRKTKRRHKSVEARSELLKDQSPSRPLCAGGCWRCQYSTPPCLSEIHPYEAALKELYSYTSSPSPTIKEIGSNRNHSSRDSHGRERNKFSSNSVTYIQPKSYSFVANSCLCHLHSAESFLPVMNRTPAAADSHCHIKEFEDKTSTVDQEKATLFQQMKAMNEQIKEQNEKIMDLENAIDDLKSQLNVSEKLLEETLQIRSNLENVNSRLRAENAKLRNLFGLKNNENAKKDESLEEKVANLKMTLLERETEIGTLRLALARWIQTTGYPLTDRDLMLLKGRSVSSESLAKKKSQTDNLVSEKPPIVPRPATASGYHNEIRRDSTNSFNAQVTRTPVFPRGRSASPGWNAHNENGEIQQLFPQQFNTIPRQHGAQILQNKEEIKQHDKTLNSALTRSSLMSDNSRKTLSASEYVAKGNNKLKVPSIDRRKLLQEDDDMFINQKLNQRSNPDLARIAAIKPPPEFSTTKEHKTKGSIKRIFDKMRRSNSSSQGFDEFTRGGFRATTGSRSGYLSNQKRKIDVNRPFSYWEPDLIADWFSVIGLGMYSHHCRKWVKSGDHLLRSSTSEIEKGLGMKNSLHRKKLKLSLSCFANECDSLTKAASELDYLWVAKWLDDIGLPQHKEAFVEARVDGAMLHHLTIEDLIHLKVNLQLHYCSIRRSIEILRKNKFNSQCLIKRMTAEEDNVTEWMTSEISRWSCYRVVEWLRSIDLPEYASNLITTGVNGALIIAEPAFNADLLSVLINIPASKTLLRRHITAQFSKLIGHELTMEKRNFETQSGYSPLLPTTKIKAVRGNHFSIIKRKGKSSLGYENYVCPMINIEDDKSSNNDKDEELSTKSSIESNEQFINRFPPGITLELPDFNCIGIAYNNFQDLVIAKNIMFH
ncbi:liprin-beta-1-like isoform X2 [Dinothrombium tinctorium]|uniref:Liprin-beta-1-like isoform X2 n=1 Tax=Dinothrombium tinctorium TaxID=1965070 RepID=A0A443RF20_9ACAR|nr:liprin-beta-1-like isoform X2 [Dinothrombium tinctorium]RWS13844.1 liprin-beta-1-like isoform X2 [Dinothrombium tinctorium]